MDLVGKVAVVTGSTSGIGRAIATRLASEGASLVINSVSSVREGNELAAELPSALYVQGDISDPDDCDRIVSAAVAAHGRLDILVNNAGTTEVIPHADLDAATDAIWARILDVNVIGTWRMSRLAVPRLRESGGGCIINITSVAGLRAIGSSIPYGVSKAALNHMTLQMARSVGPDVRVNAVAPGLIDTPWTEDWDVIRDSVQRSAPLRRSGVPDDVAEVCLGLIRSDYVTGQVVTVDGGLTTVM